MELSAMSRRRKKPAATILTYKHVWTGRDRNGDWEYGYQTVWSDGQELFLWSLPWGMPALVGAVEIR